MTGPSLLCLGNLTIDDLYLPDGSMRSDCVGGDALYAGLAGRLWEPRTSILAPIGLDLPESVALTIESTGFDLAAMPRRAAPSIRNQIHYQTDGSRRWVLETTAEQFHELSVVPADLPDWALQSKVVLISAMSLDAQEACVRFLRGNTDAVIALDLQEDYIRGNEDRILELVGLVDLFLPSEEEVRRLTGRNDYEAIAVWLASLGPRLVAMKFSEKGSLIYDRHADALVRVPAREVMVVDPTGAGDAYCGGFLATYLQNPTDLRQAGKAGAISAAFAISGYGNEGLLAADPAKGMAQLNASSGWLPSGTAAGQ